MVLSNLVLCTSMMDRQTHAEGMHFGMQACSVMPCDLYLSKLYYLALCEGLGAQLGICLVLPEAQVVGCHDESIPIYHLDKCHSDSTLRPNRITPAGAEQ